MSRLPTSTLSPMRNPLDRSVEKRERRDAILLDRVSLATMYQRNLRKASTFETTVSFVPRVAMRSVQGCEETMSRWLHSNSHVPAYCSCNIASCHHRYRVSCSFRYANVSWRSQSSLKTRTRVAWSGQLGPKSPGFRPVRFGT